MTAGHRQTPGWTFYQQQVTCLETNDLDALVEQYNDDAVLVSFDRTVRGREALRAHFAAYLAGLGGLQLKSTDRFTETEDSVFFEATIVTARAEARVYDVFIVRDGKITHQFTGTLSITPLTQA